MPTFIYRCPNTGYLVQGATSEEVSDDGEHYVAISCDLCRRNPSCESDDGRNPGRQEYG